MNVTAWSLFWTMWLLIAGAAFLVITAIVTVLGFRDLKSLFRMLRAQDQGE